MANQYGLVALTSTSFKFYAALLAGVARVCDVCGCTMVYLHILLRGSIVWAQGHVLL